MPDIAYSILNYYLMKGRCKISSDDFLNSYKLKTKFTMNLIKSTNQE